MKALLFLVSSMALAVADFSIDHVPNQLIVAYRDGISRATIDRRVAAQGGRVVVTFRSVNAALVEFKANNRSLRSRAERFDKDRDVLYVEPNGYVHAISILPNDPDFSKLYGLTLMKAPDAWSISTGSRSVVIGVIDTGIDYKHPDLKNNIWKNPGETGIDAEGDNKETNGIDDDGNGYIDDVRGWNFSEDGNDAMDDHGHGTHCAGTIGAVGDNGKGVAGVNWNVSLVPIKFLSASGGGSWEAAVSSIEYATSLGLSITSNSWGGSSESETLKAAIGKAQEAGMLFVAAAGNSGANSDTNPMYPAAYDWDNIVSVAATDSTDQLASFSNYGKVSVDLAAPGVKIWSTKPGGDYQMMSGTSMAAPHVAGVLGLILAKNSDLSAEEAKKILLESVDPIEALSEKMVSGGRANAYRAVSRLK